MNLVSLKDWSSSDVNEVVTDAILIKEDPEKYGKVLRGKTLAMLFAKPSTRTRVSFEVGMSQMGGHALYLDWKATQLSKAALEDEIQSISRYVDVIMARVFNHNDIEVMASISDKPVINGLSDDFHPCQALADMMTIREKFGDKKITIGYVGDGNNVCNSLIHATNRMGHKMIIATPKGYEPKVTADNITLTNNKQDLVGSDVIYTDTWTSMGQEKEEKEREATFKDFQVDKELIKDSLFMHCLPAYRGKEVTNEVMDSDNSLVFDQAENRLHTQKAIILKILGKL